MLISMKLLARICEFTKRTKKIPHPFDCYAAKFQNNNKITDEELRMMRKQKHLGTPTPEQAKFNSACALVVAWSQNPGDHPGIPRESQIV